MGKRILEIDASILVEMCKVGDGAARYSVPTRNALPEDAEVIGIYEHGFPSNSRLVRLLLESSEWDGDSGETLPRVEMTRYEYRDSR